VKEKYNLFADALPRMYESTSRKLYDGDDGKRSSKTAAEHANVEFLSVNVLNAGNVHVDKSVVEELQKDYGKDERTRRSTMSLGRSSRRLGVCCTI
jgi:hypothetical protein